VEEGLIGEKKFGVPSETLFENRAGLHFPSGSEKLGQRIECGFEKGILNRFNRMKGNVIGCE
jgi:hypothetical protein